MSRIERLANWVRTFVYMTFLTLAVFLLINLASYFIFSSIRDKGAGLNARKYFVAPLSEEGRARLRENLPNPDFEAALRLMASDPGFRAHPALGYTEGLSTPGYRVGIESVRYQSNWSDPEIKGWLSKSHQHSYVFGGSTAFGHGVGGDQTLPAALNRIRPETLHLNFAIQAYDSMREVDRLLHLLRKGYRPARVIFLDGLNDLTTLAWSPYPPLEKPRTQLLLADRGEVPLIFGHPRNNNMLRALAFSLPVVQLIRHWQWQARFRNFEVERRHADRDPVDWQELLFYYTRWIDFQPDRAEELAAEWIDYYARNREFVRHLGRAFGFEATLVLQPIGPADKDNPFIRPAYLQSGLWRLYTVFLSEARRAIEQGRLDILDCSSAFGSRVAESYVDVSHYSPLGNELLAQCISDAENSKFQIPNSR